MILTSKRRVLPLLVVLLGCVLASAVAQARPLLQTFLLRPAWQAGSAQGSDRTAAGGCVIGDDGTLQCGRRLLSAVVLMPPQGRFVAISVGAHHACAIRSNGSVICWGQNDSAQLDAPRGLKAVAIWAGERRSCALSDSGGKYCWGDAEEQGLSGFSWALGSRMEESTRGAAIAAGDGHACALDADARPQCWGDERLGQTLAPARPMRALDVRGDQGCGILFDGAVRCWGNGPAAQGMPEVGTFRSIDVGQFNACGVRADGSGACWGWNVNGQGNVPVGLYRRIATGLNHSCGLHDDGSVACWGYGGDGQTLAPAGVFRDIDVGERHSCALRADGSLVCWGLGTEGQTAAPVSASGYRKLAVGAFHACALRGDGGIDCWGRNDHGQATAPAGRFVSVAAGFSHTCAVREDRKTVCWGDDSFGQLAGRVESRGAVRPKTDTTPPVIDAVITGTLGDNGWYVSDVHLQWVVTDPESPVQIVGGCQDVVLAQDTWQDGAEYSCYAISEGSIGPAYPSIRIVTLKRDATPPQITMSDSTAPRPSGWYLSDVDILFSCFDGASGVQVGCHASHRVTTEGTTTLTHQAKDLAGNVASMTYDVKLDKTPPVISAVLPTGTLVLNTPFDTQLTGSDAVSGMHWARAECSPIALALNSREAFCRVFDIAGNFAQKTSTYTTVYAFEGFLAPFERSDVLYDVEVDRNLPFTWWVRDALGVSLPGKSLGWIEQGQITCPDLPVVRIDWRGAFQRIGQRVLPDGSHRLDTSMSQSAAGKCYMYTLVLLDQTKHTRYLRIRPRTMLTGGPLRPTPGASPAPQVSGAGQAIEVTEAPRGRKGSRGHGSRLSR
ncbi:MAG: hypothetical protein JF600_05120 [Xanthomonadales bacterium]|nr:hypothetical protein [Xanthomonadales bacterium]